MTILSLQGCMAVGKTTAVHYLKQHAPHIHISYEDNTDILATIRSQNWDKTKFEDYLEIQKLWIQNEISRYQKAQEFPATIMDFGAEEIEFYTLNYPTSIGKDWPVENYLQKELDDLRKCFPKRILFLDASEQVLRERKSNDTNRSRNFFEHYLHQLLPLKRNWFADRADVDWLAVDNLSVQQVGEQVLLWCNQWIQNDIVKNKLG